MSHPFHTYIATSIEEDLQRRRVVVFYDPRSEFTDFIAELGQTTQQSNPKAATLPRVAVHETPSLLVQFSGSFFQVKADAEPNMALTEPEPMLVYIPGVERDRQSSVLMEMEKAGTSYEPQLRRLARNALRKRYTDGDIDEMLAPNSLSYHDIVQFLSQEGSAQPSLVKLVLGEGNSENLITRWLANAANDLELETKHATQELYKLLQSRLGFTLTADTALPKARRQVTRYVLVNEFRSDLTCEAPSSLNLVPPVPSPDEHQRVRAIAEDLRQHHAESYIELADSIEAEMTLTSLAIAPAALGSIDTFRFEERILLEHAAQLCCDRQYQQALSIVSERSRSFWVDRYITRLAQWEVCRLVAELGQHIEQVQPQVKRMGTDAQKWVQAYADPDGWFQVDRSQRTLESWLAKMDDEPEAQLEKAIGLVRRAHEALLETMAQGFTAAIVANKWTVPGVLHQTQVYPQYIEGRSGRIAYFLVDAMRYEMGADLAEQLHDVTDLTLLPAIGSLPSITPIGMASLLPGASASFSVVESKGKLASQIDGSIMPNLNERMKFLKTRNPNVKDIDLGELLQKSASQLKRKLAEAPLLVVRSQSIDGLGEMDGGLLARQIMDTVVGNLARAVRKLAKMGFETFVIASDHGHQFSLRKEEDMMMDKPGGACVDQHRRCWAGHGGQTPGDCIRVSAQELGYDSDLDFIFPKGLAVFKAGGDLAFHHGGISLQEMVIPILHLRLPSQSQEAAPVAQITLEGYPTILTNRTFGMRIFRQVELLNPEPLSVRLVLLAEGREVGRAGMALDAEFDRVTSCVMVPASQEISVAMMLTSDEFKTIRVVAQDPSTDAVLAQSENITVSLSL